MIDLICSKCQTTLPVEESKIGTRVFVCPNCAFPLEASSSNAPTEPLPPLPVVASEDATIAPDLSHQYVQEKLREAAAKRAAKAKEAAEAEPAPSLKKKPGRSVRAGVPRSLLIGGVAAGAAAALIVAAVGIVALVRGLRTPLAPVVPPSKDLVQNDTDRKPPMDKEPPSIEALAGSLKEGRGLGRKQALQELAKRGAEARPALPAVLGVLKEPELQALAYETLAKMGPATKSDVPTFAAALRDAAPEVRAYGAGRLAELGQDAGSELVYLRLLSVDVDPRVQEAAEKAVVKLEAELLTSLEKGLQNKSAVVRARSARELADMGANARPALPALVDALADNNSAVRVAVLDAFQAIGPDAIAVLGETMRDKNPQKRLTAISALGRMGSDARFVMPELIGALGGDVKTKEEALQVFGRLGDFAIPYLMEALEREKTPARQKPLIEALQRMGPGAAPALKAALKSAKPEVTKVAATVVAKIESRPPPPPRPDLTGAAGQNQTALRGWFYSGDTNKDGYLDKDELARVIRGPTAKAYDDTASGKPARQFGPNDFPKYPDYAFLCRVDRDNDGRVSRDEYEQWAYEHADFMAKDHEARERIRQEQNRLMQQNQAEALRVRNRLMEQSQAQALRLQREAAVVNMWAAYHNQRTINNAQLQYMNQANWLQRWQLNHLPKRK